MTEDTEIGSATIGITIALGAASMYGLTALGVTMWPAIASFIVIATVVIMAEYMFQELSQKFSPKPRLVRVRDEEKASNTQVLIKDDPHGLEETENANQELHSSNDNDADTVSYKDNASGTEELTEHGTDEVTYIVGGQHECNSDSDSYEELDDTESYNVSSQPS